MVWTTFDTNGLASKNLRDESLIKERFMDKATMEHFRRIFLEILSDEEATQTQLDSLDKHGDEFDALSVEKENQIEFRLMARNAVYLKKVRKSLQKIADGTFGECEDCGAEITLNRLHARPTADLCIHCKELTEREENQLVHRNRTSLKGDRMLPIAHLEKGYLLDDTATSSFSLRHGSYQDVV